MPPITHNRLFAFLGIGSVVLELGAVAIGAVGGRQFATISSTPAQMQSAVAKHVGVSAWIGAYLELLAFGMFLAFAIWAARGSAADCWARSPLLRRPPTPRSASPHWASATPSPTPLGHPMGIGLVSFTVHIERGAVRLHLVPDRPLPARHAGPLAIGSGRRVIGWSGIAVAHLRPSWSRPLSRSTTWVSSPTCSGWSGSSVRACHWLALPAPRPPGPKWRWPDGDNAGGGANRSATRTSTEIRRRLDAADQTRFLAGQAGRGLTGSPPRRWIAGFWFGSR